MKSTLAPIAEEISLTFLSLSCHLFLTLLADNAGGNVKGGTDKNALKLDLETEELSHATVNSEVKKAIQQGRLAKKLTQAQLAQQINEKPQIIQEYETGKAIPNQQILGKLERILGVKLRGKKK